MAIPFFRKGKDKPQGVARRATPEAAGPATTQWGDPLGPNSGIIVEDSSGAPQSAIDEAAILYASGQADMAEATLKPLLGSDNRRAWYMLFDLYRIQNREKDFEQLALDYAMRFESSPPVWQKIGSTTAKAAPTTAGGQGEAAMVELPSLLNAAAADRLRGDLGTVASNAPVRIDFSHIEMVDEGGASECTRILGEARKDKRRLKVSGVDRLIDLLKDLNRATHSRAAHWLLLLELYQTLGQEEAFEDLAVDYAVRFEVSPPSWVAVTGAEVVQAPVTGPAAEEPEVPALALAGEITPANESALQKFGDYAASHDPVVVDLTQVTRVDYGSVSSFISTLMQCLGSGKTITLRGHNALIHELFRVMGIDQLARLVPHHPD